MKSPPQGFCSLQRNGDVEYMATHTDEGRGVYHLALVSPYLPWSVVREMWKKRTGADRVNISYERNFDAMLREMTLQQEMARYSFSRGFLPDGARKAIEAICCHFRGKIRYQAIAMLARRWRRSDALSRTVSCAERIPWGRFCYLSSREEVLHGA